MSAESRLVTDFRRDDGLQNYNANYLCVIYLQGETMLCYRSSLLYKVLRKNVSEVIRRLKLTEPFLISNTPLFEFDRGKQNKSCVCQSLRTETALNTHVSITAHLIEMTFD